MYFQMKEFNFCISRLKWKTWSPDNATPQEIRWFIFCGDSVVGYRSGQLKQRRLCARGDRGCSPGSWTCGIRAARLQRRTYERYEALAARLWIWIQFMPRVWLYIDASFLMRLWIILARWTDKHSVFTEHANNSLHERCLQHKFYTKKLKFLKASVASKCLLACLLA